MVPFKRVFSQTDSTQNDTISLTPIELNIFPNPNKGVFYITTFLNESYHSQLYNMEGELIQNQYLRSGRNYVKLDVPSGIYVLIAQKNGMKKEFKIVVNR